MVKPLADRISEIFVDTTDPDWGEMEELDIARVTQEYEAELRAERQNVLDAQWALESGWVSSDLASSVINTVDFESFQAGITEEESTTAAALVRSARFGGQVSVNGYQQAA